MSNFKKKSNCLIDLKIYYGISPYANERSTQSGTWYLWLKTKYGKKLIKECEEELNVS